MEKFRDLFRVKQATVLVYGKNFKVTFCVGGQMAESYTFTPLLYFLPSYLFHHPSPLVPGPFTPRYVNNLYIPFHTSTFSFSSSVFLHLYVSIPSLPPLLSCSNSAYLNIKAFTARRSRLYTKWTIKKKKKELNNKTLRIINFVSIGFFERFLNIFPSSLTQIT